MDKKYGWRERKASRLRLIGTGLLMRGIGCVVTLFLRDMNWLWGCYTFELCLLRPYRNGSAIEVVSVVLAVVGEAVSLAGF